MSASGIAFLHSPGGGTPDSGFPVERNACTVGNVMIATHPLFDLAGRTALITGSSPGIGLALARGLGQAGAGIVLNGRDETRLAAAAATLRTEGLKVTTAAFDAPDAAAISDAVTRVETEVASIATSAWRSRYSVVSRAQIEAGTPAHRIQTEIKA